MPYTHAPDRPPPRARQEEIQRLLHSNPQGLTLGELAVKLHCNRRTIQRDIAFLRDLLMANSETEEPLRCTNGRYYLRPGEYPLAPISLSPYEARALLFAARLFVHHANRRDDDALEALEKVAGAFSGPMAERFHETIAELRIRPTLERNRGALLRPLTRAWQARRTVRLRYRATEWERARVILVDPYFIEPGKTNSAIYIYGYRHDVAEVRTFVLDRILDVEVLEREFVPRDAGEMAQMVARSWSGSVHGREEHRVVLRFRNTAARLACESHWHPTQRWRNDSDGSTRMEVTLPTLIDFVSWVLRWGPDVEVVEPAELREKVAAAVRAAAAMYDGAA